MPNILEITTLDAPELAAYAQLTQPQLRARQEPAQGLFIAEGLKVIGHALDAGCVPVSFLVERRHITGKARETLERCGDIPVYTADSTLLARLTGFALTRGVLCAMRRPAPKAMDEVCAGARRIVVLEGLVDPTNVGAIFRNAAALGADAVLLAPNCCDPLGRRAVRVSMGSVFQIPWARLPAAQWPRDGLARLRREGFRIVAMALDARAVSLEETTLATEEKLAILFGAEGDGLSASAIAACDASVCIPMAHGVDSLNVAAASAIALWALRRKTP